MALFDVIKNKLFINLLVKHYLEESYISPFPKACKVWRFVLPSCAMSETGANSTQKGISGEDQQSSGEDFYFEDGLMVFTALFHRKRGRCCRNGCRHCPYGFQKVREKTPE